MRSGGSARRWAVAAAWRRSNGWLTGSWGVTRRSAWWQLARVTAWVACCPSTSAATRRRSCWPWKRGWWPVGLVAVGRALGSCRPWCSRRPYACIRSSSSGRRQRAGRRGGWRPSRLRWWRRWSPAGMVCSSSTPRLGRARRRRCGPHGSRGKGRATGWLARRWPPGPLRSFATARGSRPAPSRGCSATWTIPGARGWMPGRCWWWMRPAWSAPARWRGCSAMPSGRAPRWCCAGMWGSCPRSRRAGCFVRCGSGSAAPSWSTTVVSSSPGSGPRWTRYEPGTHRPRSPATWPAGDIAAIRKIVGGTTILKDNLPTQIKHAWPSAGGEVALTRAAADTMLLELTTAAPYFIPATASGAVLGSHPPAPALLDQLRLPFPHVLVIFGTDLELDPATHPWPQSLRHASSGTAFDLVHGMITRGGYLTGMVLLADPAGGRLRDDLIWIVAAQPRPRTAPASLPGPDPRDAPRLANHRDHGPDPAHRRRRHRLGWLATARTSPRPSRRPDLPAMANGRQTQRLPCP